MLRISCIFCLISVSLTGCGVWNAGRGVIENTFRRPNSRDVDDYAAGPAAGDVNGWGGSDFMSARQNVPVDSGDPLLSSEARDIERRVGIE